jgi:hypothetical protein
LTGADEEPKPLNNDDSKHIEERKKYNTTRKNPKPFFDRIIW